MSKMPEEDALAMAARYRESAEALRVIAEKIQFDPRRRNQTLALADAFARAAERIEKQLPDPE